MKKEKLTLEALKVQSFAQVLSAEQMEQTRGGFQAVRGRRYNYRTRWTAIDTRVDVIEQTQVVTNGNHGG